MSAFLPVLAFVNSVWGWVVIGFVALLIFGSRLPHVARNLGKGINEFKKGLNEGAEGDRSEGPGDGRRLPAEPARKSHIDETSV